MLPPILRPHVLAVLTGLATAGTAAAQEAPPAPPGRAAFLFDYRIEPGRQSLFDAGYRRHLAWHADKGDRLVWYAWYVVAGNRVGEFVDGTFGTTFEAFDHRVDVAGDVKDFAENAAPFATPLRRSAWELVPDLGTDRTLEERRPSPILEVVHVTARPGAGKAFEARLRKTRERLEATGDPLAYAWYRLVVGGREPGWLLLVSRNGWSDWARSPVDLDAWLGGGDLVTGIESEVWVYRPDLSYFPSDH